MTTTVRVMAHCASNKEVVVTIKEANADIDLPLEVFVLQDGETADHVVFDDRVISIREVVKDSGL